MFRILSLAFLVLLTQPVLAQNAQSENPNNKISSLLSRALNDPAEAMRQADGTWGVWVHFTDKGLDGAQLNAALTAVENDLPERTLQRRAKVKPAGQRLVNTGDLPLSGDYMDAVTATGAQARRQSRWLNAASFDATREQISAIAGLPFVQKVELVAKFIRPQPKITPEQLEAARRARDEAAAKSIATWNLSYGGSTAGLEQINVPPVHDLGLSGDGIIIGMLDSGFNTTHIALQNIPVLAQYDFVNDDEIVADEPGDPLYAARHGTNTLSTIMGFMEGELVGSAYGASAILAKTEDISDETPIEEDNWVAGIEWVEQLGADVVTSSLGYYYWYEYSDLDGNTALCTIAADLAVGLGVCVVNCAGNQRGDEDWPYLITPADGDSVNTIGAVTLSGDIADFSSPGPTYDGRIKPDMVAQGVGNHAASYYDDESYNTVNGTSFSAPLIAGVSALMLERVPTLTPMQILEALRMTADRSTTPDNDFGWGLVDAYAAATYWGPAFEHDPLPDTEDTAGPYTVLTTITDRNPLDPAGLFLYWRVDGGLWNQVALTDLGNDQYSADIPGQTSGGLVEYYLEASDVLNITILSPQNAPADLYVFGVGVDTTAPTLQHANLIDQVLLTWPPTLSALATDNLGMDRVEMTYSLNGGPSQGPYFLIPSDDLYTLEFPLPVESVQVGDEFSYDLNAFDTATVPNSSVSGPHTFYVVESLGNVLIIMDNFGSPAKAEGYASKSGGDIVAEVSSSATDMGMWLEEAGYVVGFIDADDLEPDSFMGYDALILSCGNNQFALSNPVMRDMVINWVLDGGRILVEGGEVAYPALVQPGYPEFAQYVLHGQAWWGDLFAGEFPFNPAAGHEDHFFLNRPTVLPSPVTLTVPGYDFGAADVVYQAPDALAIMHTVYNVNTGGILVYDDNTGVEAGQIVYFTFDVSFVDEATGRQLTENGMAYLLSREAPGNASISGTVTLVGTSDASGVTVSCGEGHSVITGPDGAYTIDGLHGSTYTVTATKDDYGPAEQVVVLMADQSLTDVDFLLQPVFAVGGTASPGVPIPDNDEIGVTSVITITETGDLYDVNIDVDISHFSIGHLVVTLTSPEGTSVVLHNQTGAINDNIVGNWPATLTVDGPGELADFAGEPIQGDWTMHVADIVPAAIGTFNSWGLNLLATSGGPTAVGDDLPQVTRVTGNAPNPFNPLTVIAFELATAGPVQLDIYDVRGHHIRRLVESEMAAGVHQVRWDGRDATNQSTASGVYFCRLSAAGQTHLHKMMLVR